MQESTELSGPNKRRKFYRRRAEVDDDIIGALSATEQVLSPSPAPIDDVAVARDILISPPSVHNKDEEYLSVADILRRRKNAQRKKAGIEFSSGISSSSTPPLLPSLELVKKDDDDELPAEIKAMGNRFAPQTGRVTEETDKHMTAYIDHELAKRTQSTQNSQVSPRLSLSPNGTPIPVSNNARTRNPASQGKLHEIDLGPSATILNIARTEAAISGSPAPPPPPRKPPKPRIGRNGKPYIPRPRVDRNRRNSADIARDKVVEDILRETRLEVYDDPRSDTPEEAEQGQGEDEPGAADDRMAEQFRREFLDAMSQRREKANKMPGSGAAGGKAGEDRPRGPKLGGSRSARAAMKEREEAAAKASGGKGRR